MNCTEIIDQLSAYIDGALDAETRAAVEQHLHACPACAKEYEELAACVAQLRALPVKQAPADLARRVHERLAPRFSIPYRLAGVAAGLLLVVIAADVVRETRQKVPLSSGVTAPVASHSAARARHATPVEEPRKILPADAGRNTAVAKRGIAAPSAARPDAGLSREAVSDQALDTGGYAFEGTAAKRSAVPTTTGHEPDVCTCAAPAQSVSETVTTLHVKARAEISDATRRELAALVERLQGTVLDYGFSDPLPALMAARIPAGRLQELTDGLSRFGVLETKPPQPARDTEYQIIVISLDRPAQ